MTNENLWEQLTRITRGAEATDAAQAMRAEAERRGWSTTFWMPDSRPGSWGWKLRHPDQPRTVWRVWHDGHDLDEASLGLENRRMWDRAAWTNSPAGIFEWIDRIRAGARPCAWCGRHDEAARCLSRERYEASR